VRRGQTRGETRGETSFAEEKNSARVGTFSKCETSKTRARKKKNVRLKTRTTGETETDGRMNGDLNRGPRIRHPAFLDATSVVG